MIDLRRGRYQDMLSSTQADALICDPPYSERTPGARRADLQRCIERDYHIEVGDSGVRSATARQPDLWSGR